MVDEQQLCAHRRVPMWPGQTPARCDKPAGHWPDSDHHWVEDSGEDQEAR